MKKQNKYLLEVCAASIESAINAQKAGAVRIELCSALSEGGLTPSFGLIKQARELLKIDINVLIRPRAGDFFYSAAEFEVIKQDIIFAKNAGANGIVIGLLLPSGKVDVKRMKELVKLAKPLPITFHRAFDMCDNFGEALEDLISLGCVRILTSGGGVSAINTINQLKFLVKKADERIIIMPGAGITDENIAIIAKETKATEFHASGKTKVFSKMLYRNENAYMGTEALQSEYTHLESGYEQIKRLVDVLEEL
ncbi:MAG: copper homeostasis protein CutC [Bacteroidota bacterium]